MAASVDLRSRALGAAAWIRVRPDRAALVTAGATSLLFVLVGLVLRRTAMGEWVDLATLEALEPLHGTPGQSQWWSFAQLGAPAVYAQMGLALMATAALRGRWRLVALIPLVMLGSELMAQGVKHVLDGPRDLPAAARIDDVSWPSGHSTAAMTVALLAVLVAPRRMRPTVAVVGAGIAVAVGLGMVINGYHYPSDVLGGFLGAGIWVALGVVVLVRWEARSPVARPVDDRPLRPRHLVVPVAVLVLALVTAAARAQEGVGGIVGVVRDNTAATIVVAGIASSAVALAALLATAGAAGSVDGELSGPRPAATGARPRRWRLGRG